MAKKTIVTQGYSYTVDDLTILGTPPLNVTTVAVGRPKLTITDNTGYKQQFDDLRQLGGADGRS